MVPPVEPVAFTIGPLAVHWYGILIFTGVVVGTIYAARQAPRVGISADHIWNGLTLCVVLAVIGSRLYHVFSTPAECVTAGPPLQGCGWPWYREHPLDILAIWRGGLGIYGGIIGGALGAVIYAWRNRLPVLLALDIGAPGLALGQAIGRWGNFVNQELYGPPTGSSWWGLRIDAQHRLLQYPISQYPYETTLFHPTFLYESLWSLLTFLVLAFIWRKWMRRLRPGDIVAGYLIAYGTGRFWIEQFFRPDAWVIGTLAAAQWVGLALIAVGLAVIVTSRLRARKRSASPQEGES